MKRTWWKVAKNNRIHTRNDDTTYYLCGVGIDPFRDLKYTEKPRTGIFCKNCLRVINKK